MLKRKTIISIVVILLFVGLSFIPTTACVVKETTLLPNNETGLLYDLCDRIQTADNEQDFIDIIDNFLKDKRVAKYPFLVKLLKSICDDNNFGRRQTFIISYGSTNRLPFFAKEQKTKIIKPLTFWRYGEPKLLLLPKSKTVIVERDSYDVKTISGRQIGFMIGFAGFYIERDSILSDKSYVFFIGRAIAVRGFKINFPYL